MDKDQISDAALEALLEETRAFPPQVPEALMRRVLEDAATAQPAPASAPRLQGWRGLLDRFGGLPALGGMLTATCVGIWLGLAPPMGLPDLAGQVLGVVDASEEDTTSPSLSGFGWDIGEG